MRYIILSIIVMAMYIGITEYRTKHLRTELINAYVKNSALVEQIANQNQEIANLEISIDKASNQMEKINLDLNKSISETRLKLESLQDKIQETSQKLDKVASKKPTLVERKINKASEKAIRCFESISRGEKNLCDF